MTFPGSSWILPWKAPESSPVESSQACISHPSHHVVASKRIGSDQIERENKMPEHKARDYFSTSFRAFSALSARSRSTSTSLRSNLMYSIAISTVLALLFPAAAAAVWREDLLLLRLHFLRYLGHQASRFRWKLESWG
jgi:hypothetical protein